MYLRRQTVVYGRLPSRLPFIPTSCAEEFVQDSDFFDYLYRCNGPLAVIHLNIRAYKSILYRNWIALITAPDTWSKINQYCAYLLSMYHAITNLGEIINKAVDNWVIEIDNGLCCICPELSSEPILTHQQHSSGIFYFRSYFKIIILIFKAMHRAKVVIINSIVPSCARKGCFKLIYLKFGIIDVHKLIY